MRTSDSINELIKAMVAARSAFTPIRKEAVGQIGSDRTYRYADLSGLLEATMPALSANGLTVMQAVDAETATLVTRIAHTSGEWAEATYPLPMNLQPQQFGSSLTYGRRYSLAALLCLAAEDDDGAAAYAPPPKRASKATKDDAISDAQRKRLFSIATAAGWTTDQIKAYLQRVYHVHSSKELTVRVYDQVCQDFDRPPDALEMPF